MIRLPKVRISEKVYLALIIIIFAFLYSSLCMMQPRISGNLDEKNTVPVILNISKIGLIKIPDYPIESVEIKFANHKTSDNSQIIESAKMQIVQIMGNASYFIEIFIDQKSWYEKYLKESITKDKENAIKKFYASQEKIQQILHPFLESHQCAIDYKNVSFIDGRIHVCFSKWTQAGEYVYYDDRVSTAEMQMLLKEWEKGIPLNQRAAFDLGEYNIENYSIISAQPRIQSLPKDNFYSHNSIIRYAPASQKIVPHFADNISILSMRSIKQNDENITFWIPSEFSIDRLDLPLLANESNIKKDLRKNISVQLSKSNLSYFQNFLENRTIVLFDSNKSPCYLTKDNNTNKTESIYCLFNRGEWTEEFTFVVSCNDYFYGYCSELDKESLERAYSDLMRAYLKTSI